MIFEVQANVLNVTVEENLYSEDTVFKCFYWYSGKFSVEINKVERSFRISLRPKTESEPINWNEVIEKIKQDLVDYKLRAIVLKETGTIRELIVAKAFAYYQETDPPTTVVSDPVGFNPEHIKLYE